MPDVEELLHRYAAGAERSVPATPPRAPRAPRGRGARWLALAVAAAVVGAVLVVTLDDDDQAAVSTDPSVASSMSTITTGGKTVTTGPATRSLRVFPVVAVTDTEYLVWSGEAGDNETSARADGFAVDLATGAVRPIPLAPIAPRSGATGIWTGDELIVCCGATGPDTRSAAAWDPASGRWRSLAAPPTAVTGSYAAAVWTGQEMIVVAPGGGAAYDPTTDEWQDIAPPPLEGRQPEAAWAGDAVVVWDSSYGSGVHPDEEVADRGYWWRPGDGEWTPLPELPPGSRTRMGSMAWTGTEVVVWGQSTGDDTRGVGARWRLGDHSWRAVAPWPHAPLSHPYDGTPGSQTLVPTADGRVLVKGLDGGSTDPTDRYDPESDTWVDLGFTLSGYHPTVTVAGEQVLIPDEERALAGRVPRGR